MLADPVRDVSESRYYDEMLRNYREFAVWFIVYYYAYYGVMLVAYAT